MSTASPFESLYQEELYSLPSRTMIVIDREWNDLSDEDKTLLNKILGSVKLSPASVQILHRSALTTGDLIPLNPQRVISFGVDIPPVQKRYEYVPIDGLQIIVADGLSALDDARKKNLWQALRQMFGL